MKIPGDANEIIAVLTEDINQVQGVFRMQPCVDWQIKADTMDNPKKLFDSFWYENEVCILFSDTNLGKSALAVQIADSITKGIKIPGFDLEAETQKVALFDFELSTKQFAIRYQNAKGDNYPFDPMFLRAEIDPYLFSDDAAKTPEIEITESIESAITSHGPKVVIIDNLTYLHNRAEKSEHAAPLMKHLISLKKKHDLSMLVLSHTPKRDTSRPISKNDLVGSKMLVNFCDSCFSIGESQNDDGIRYFKQLKSRNSAIQYGADNVVVSQLSKDDDFLGFKFMNYADESEFLTRMSKDDRQERRRQARQWADEGVSNVEIGKRLKVSEGAIRKWRKEDGAPF